MDNISTTDLGDDTATDHDTDQQANPHNDDGAEQQTSQQADQETLDPRCENLRKNYEEGPGTIRLGSAVVEGDVYGDVPVTLSLSMLNRHGLVAGATGTGKTRTLQLFAEQLSSAGVPVLITDVKGDLSGLLSPGTESEKLAKRVKEQHQFSWKAQGFPTELLAIGESTEKSPGVPIRTTVEDFGPLLLSRALGLNATQEQALHLIVDYATTEGLQLYDLQDLSSVITFLTTDPDGKKKLSSMGGVSTATAGVILRSLAALSIQGGDAFFGLPAFDTDDLMRVSSTGKGVISLLNMTHLSDSPSLVSAFVLWLLHDLFHRLPEVGDVEKPRIVFFFDEAHLLFDGASAAFLSQVEQTVKLIRSKGVGIFFITQTSQDIPEAVLGQLATRVQHALRAFTPKDMKAIKATVATFPLSDFPIEQLLTSLGVGEALITSLDPQGRPTPVAPTRLWAPQSVMGPAQPEAIRAAINGSPLAPRYSESRNEESAQEKLDALAAQKKEAEEKAAREEAAAKEKERKAKEKERREKEALQEERRRARERARRKNSPLGKASQRAAKALGKELSKELSKGSTGKKLLGSVIKALLK